MKLKIGDLIYLRDEGQWRDEFLGQVGIVIDVYGKGKDSAHIILQGGDDCGYNKEEQEFMDYLGFDDSMTDYEYKGAILTLEDYRNGRFTPSFAKALHLKKEYDKSNEEVNLFHE